MDDATHLSAFTLDRLALGQTPAADERAHLEACQRCRDQLQASRPLPAEAPVPAWLPRGRWRLRWPLTDSLLVAAALAALVVALPASFLVPPPPEAEQTRPKGFPAVAVHVEHRGAVRLWDGRSPVAAGDRLQLRVAPAGFRYLLVGTPGPDGWTVLHQGPVSPRGESALPRSFRVDQADAQLALGLLLCDAPCEASELEAAAREAPRDAHRWWTRLQLERGDEP